MDYNVDNTKMVLKAHRAGAVLDGEPDWEKIEALNIHPELLQKWKAHITAQNEMYAVFYRLAEELNIDMSY